MDLIVATDQGLYCPPGDFHIDPWRPVARALITHGHGDHARSGSKVYVCQRDSAPILSKRLGEGITVEPVGYGETLTRNGVSVSFHPAGHVLGSAQIRVEHRGRGLGRLGRLQAARRTASARRSSRSAAMSSLPNRPSPCRSTAGAPQTDVFAEIDDWRRDNAAAGRASVDLRLRARQGAAADRQCRSRRSGRSSVTARSRRSTICTARPA